MAMACQPNEIDVLGDGTKCQTIKFTLTTTQNTTSLKFTMTAIGEFNVDCNDGGILSGDGVSDKTISRLNTNIATYTCTWDTAGGHSVHFGGVATNYSTNTNVAAISFNTTTKTNVASVSGNMSSVFPYISDNALNGAQPRFYYTFKECTNLTTVSADLFADYTIGADYMFDDLFAGDTKLGAIPNGFFANIVTAGEQTFRGTFYNCTTLTSIPDDLFQNLTDVAKETFYGTFHKCSNITAIPPHLFANVTSAAQSLFFQTFYECSKLSGFIPPLTFAGLIANGSPNASNMWWKTFDSTRVLTECPENHEQYITGYEGTNNNTTWNNRVSCGCEKGYWGDGVTCVACNNKPVNGEYYGISFTSNCTWGCADGYYANGDTCDVCGNTKPANSSWVPHATSVTCTWECDAGYAENNGTCDAIVCTGATYYDENARSCISCPVGYTYDTTTGKTSVSQCQIQCDAGMYLASNYTELEYIESTSALKQYIDTGYIPQTNNVSGDMRVVPTKNISHVDIIGSSNLSIGYNGGNRFFIWAEAPGELKYTAPFTVGAMYDINFEVTATGRTLTVNGESVSDGKGGVSTGSIKLFRNDNTTNFIGRIYGVTFSDGGNLIFNLIPARRNSDGVIGMYNMVNGEFLTNAGSGAFVAGGDVGTLGACEYVGNGYYASASVLNYGQTGIRNQCPDNGTTGIDNASNISQCSTRCTGVVYAEVCHKFCPNIQTLQVGNLTYPVFADRTNVASPVLHVLKDNTECYLYAEENGTNTNPGLRLRDNNTVYRIIDPRT